MSGGNRVLAYGSRTYTDRPTMWNALGARPRTVLIQGEAGGGDKLAKQWARFYRVPVLCFPADWHKFKRAAGHIRNTQQLREGRPDEAIGGITGPVGSVFSRGSADMTSKLVAAGVPVAIYRDGGEREGGAS